MTRRKRVELILIGAGAAACVLAAYAARDFVHTALLLPVWVRVQWVLVYVRSVPQQYLWLGLLGVGFYIVYRSFRSKGSSPPLSIRWDTRRTDRLTELYSWIVLGRRRLYYRERLAKLLAETGIRAGGIKPHGTPTPEALLSAGFSPPGFLKEYLNTDSDFRRDLGVLFGGRRERKRYYRRLQAAIEWLEYETGERIGDDDNTDTS